MDVLNDLSRYWECRKVSRNQIIRCGNHFVRILGYGTVDVDIRLGSKRGVPRIREATHCLDFMANLVSFGNLREREIFWDTEKNQLYKLPTCSAICSLQQIESQQVIDLRLISRKSEAFAASRIPRRIRITNRNPRPPRKGGGPLWHQRLRHSGLMAIHKLAPSNVPTEVSPR